MADKPATKPAVKRVYPITKTEGAKPIYIEAASKSAAIVHAYSPFIGTPLSGAEVLALIREHGQQAIEVAQ